MIEKLTTQKLKKYGFDSESINRLTTWKKYECYLVNNRGYFVASNIEGKIYSGKEGKEKQFEKSLIPHPSAQPKEKFDTFEDLFRYAVLTESVVIPESKWGKDFSYGSQERIHNLQFNVWLQNCKGWEYGNEPQYKEHLTRQTWVEYLEYCENEKNIVENRIENIKNQWRPNKIKTPSGSEYNMFWELTGMNRNNKFQQTFVNSEMINPLNIESPFYYHIPEALERNNIKVNEAVLILSTIQSSQPEQRIKNIVKPIIEYLRTNEAILNKRKPTKENKQKSYTQKQVAIAYYVQGITITENNALGILKKHTETSSLKILQKLITKNSQLTTILETKTASTKHLNDLKRAKELLSGIKNKRAVTDIDRFISVFQTNYEKTYDN